MQPWRGEDREARCFDISKHDQRNEFERDRDRILYSSAFHRLAGITQIVRAGEFDIFHTRQQHTYKVAQIGRRLAQWRERLQPHESRWHGVDAEVVEAACLAHDLGHPPFGHAAEKELDILVQNAGSADEPGLEEDRDPDGFEGNAQTFRILTKLAVRFDRNQCHGLDLTRATLAATLKYPWLRDHEHPDKQKKWSAYRSERAQFEWAREFAITDVKTAEAELMDLADDIAYSVHDLEDFHRVGVIPWSAIFSDDNRDRLVNEVSESWHARPPDAPARIRRAWENLKGLTLLFPAVTNETYDGSRHQRFQLRNLTSALIGRYIKAATLAPIGERNAPVLISRESADEVRLLKYLARSYVIGLPALSAQQFGQRRVIRDLFKIFLSEGKTGNLKLFPPRMQYLWEDHHDDKPARLAADCVGCLTENEAYQLHQRLTGVNSGTILDPIVR